MKGHDLAPHLKVGSKESAPQDAGASAELTRTFRTGVKNWVFEDLLGYTETVQIPPESVASDAHKLGIENVVIPGGEPLLQQKNLSKLANLLKQQCHRIEIETNGTLVPSIQLAQAIDQWNVSPKLSNSGNSAKLREVTEPLRWFAASDRAVFKFVVVEPSDLKEIEDVMDRFDIPRNRVLLSPEGTDSKTLGERGKWLVEECVKGGYRFSPRLHIMLWGDVRGR